MSGQVEYLPETLRSKMGTPPPQMIEIYDKFAKNIPGFQPLNRETVPFFTPKIVSSFLLLFYLILGNL